MRSPVELRENLAKAILNVRSGHATSRRSLAAVLRLSPSTTGYYVDQLIDAGLLIETGLEQGRMGRPKRVLSAVAGAGWFAGIEFNAERIHAVRLDFAGRPEKSLTAPLPHEAGTGQVMNEIARLITGISDQARGEFMGIGAGVPGLVDPASGTGIHYSFLPDWRNVPFRSVLQERFQTPVILENNLRVIALAERWFGGGRELDDYVILGPRSGFGIAIMKHGRLIDGRHHATGEIGRWTWPLTGEGKEMHDALCAPAVWRRLAGGATQKRQPDNLRAALAALADRRDAAWDTVVADYGRVIGLLHLLLDSGAYFLHGPLTALGTGFCDAISSEAVRLMPALQNMTPKILPSGLGDDAGALGAASLAMEAWQPSPG
ncbi:MAG: ROK family protein [Verrucomicrobiaceae bacterium]|nr:ROK family protein [Verrucomicrobiaceae bacterium]